MPVEIVYADPGGPGYHPVLYMARLAAELLDGELIVLKARNASLSEKLSFLLPRSRRGGACLVICPSPADLVSLAFVSNWRHRYDRVVAWVFDSFWVDMIPRFARVARPFDHVFVTEAEDLEGWRARLNAPVDWLPWGTDALRLGTANPDRPVDILRVGRQPSDWEDDSMNERACAARHLRFRGRPPLYEDASENHRALLKEFGDTKFSLSFSNAVSPAVQTHPKREYITGRWTDALAAGATVVGVPPRSESLDLLWDGALLDLGTTDRERGLDILTGAVREWMPARAELNRLRSLERLDWRWRFEELRKALLIDPAPLRKELAELRSHLGPAELGPAVHGEGAATQSDPARRLRAKADVPRFTPPNGGWERHAGSDTASASWFDRLPFARETTGELRRLRARLRGGSL